MNLDPKGYDIAYAKMSDYLLQFCMNVGATIESRTAFSGPVFYSTNTDYEHMDLVVVTAMSDPEFRLSWIKELIRHPSGEVEFLFQSAKTGKEQWWTNVGTYVMRREMVSEHPEWRWNNAQWGVQERWAKLQRAKDEYVIRTALFSIHDTYAVVRTRTRYSMDTVNVVRSFDWVNTTDEQLEEIYDQLIKDHEHAQQIAREQRNAAPSS